MLLETSLGNIAIDLYVDEAPKGKILFFRLSCPLTLATHAWRGLRWPDETIGRRKWDAPARPMQLRKRRTPIFLRN